MAKRQLKEHRIHRDWCKGCGICATFCPKQVLEMDSEEKAISAKPVDCVGCRTCERMCPDLAIEVELEQDDEPKD